MNKRMFLDLLFTSDNLPCFLNEALNEVKLTVTAWEVFILTCNNYMYCLAVLEQGRMEMPEPEPEPEHSFQLD